MNREENWAVLMRAALAGDQSRYEELLRALAPALRAVTARGLARAGLGAGDAEDVVQEILLAIHLKRDTWRSTELFGPWLWTIARNKLIDNLRRRGRRIELPIEDFADILPSPEPRPDAGSAEVDRHLAMLPQKQQAVVRAIAVDGEDIRAAAARMKMTPVAVRVSLHRGLASLAAKLRTTP